MSAQHYVRDEQWQSLALSAYQKAVAAQLTLPGLLVAYAQLEIARKAWPEARKSLEDEMRLDPHSLLTRGSVLISQ